MRDDELSAASSPSTRSLPHRLRSSLPVFAALDLGTNNCRLLIARAGAGEFEVLDAFSRIVRLGEGLVLSGRLAPGAMQRTIQALRICAAKLRQHRPQATRIVATEACRRAANGALFLDRVRHETGLAVEVISPADEAMLALAGCAALLDPAVERALMFDIGGGSTEVMWLEVPADGSPALVQAVLSVPDGVVSLADRYGPAAVTPEGYRAMRAEVAAALLRFDREHGIARQVGAGGVQMLGSSGTVTTLAGVHLNLARYDRRHVDGILLDRTAIAEASARIVAMAPAERIRHPCIGRARSDLVVAGCAILDAILAQWPTPELRIADRGVREGILLGLMGVPAPRRRAMGQA